MKVYFSEGKEVSEEAMECRKKISCNWSVYYGPIYTFLWSL